MQELAKTDNFIVFGTQKAGKTEIRAIDKKGFIKLQRKNTTAVKTTTGGARSIADKLWEELAVFKSDIKLNPDIYLCIGGRIVDFEGLQDATQLK